MSDPIERQAAIDALDFEIVHMTAYRDGKNEGNPLAQYNKGLEDGKKAIEALPPAQPDSCEFYDTESHFCALHRPSAQPEIIQCKDCTKYDKHDHRCKHWNHGVVVNDFCSRAERRTDEQIRGFEL